MIRRLNYTGRRKIPRDRIHISLFRTAGLEEFDAVLKVQDLDLPETARVFVEAYHKSDWMRFAYGTVGAPAIPAERRLTAFYPGARVLFRVKVVSAGEESGKILAEVDRLTPVSADDDRIREPLLPVRVVGNLGDQVWRLAWNGGPVLELNAAEPEIKHLLTGDSRFKWLILPEVFRSVLTRVLAEEMDEPEEAGEETVAGRWLKFAASLHPEPPPAAEGRDAETTAAWVDDIVAAFCRRHRALAHWRSAIRPGDDLFAGTP